MTTYTSHIEEEVIRKSQIIKSDCNSISFYNIGFGDVSVLGINIKPGGFLNFDNLHPEITDTTNYKIEFDTDSDTNKITVFRKKIKKICNP